jgi:hypothetical protein
LGFSYLFASHPHIRASLVSGGHVTVRVCFFQPLHPLPGVAATYGD